MQRIRKFLRPSKASSASATKSVIRAGNAKLRSLIAEEWQDEDGYWIALAPGYMDVYNSWCHTIHEDTKAEAYEVLRGVVKCDCPEHRGN